VTYQIIDLRFRRSQKMKQKPLYWP